MSNLRSYFKSIHPTVLLTQIRAESAGGVTAEKMSTNSTSSSAPTTTATATLTTPTTPTVSTPVATTTTLVAVRPQRSQQQTSMGSFVTGPMDPLRQRKLDDTLVKIIALDFQPFSVVEDKGFRVLKNHGPFVQFT